MTEKWEVGQHPAMSTGWIVRPVLFGSRVTVLPESEGGHVVIKSEKDAHLIAAAPDLLEALEQLLAIAEMTTFSDQCPLECETARAALSKAKGSAGHE